VPFIAGVRRSWPISGVRTTALVGSGTLALGSLTGILLARELGPTARGELVAASVGPQVIAVLMTFKIEGALFDLPARAKAEHVGQIFGSALLAVGIVGLLAAGLYELLQWFYFAPAVPGVSAITLYAFATFPFVNICTQVMLGAVRARQQSALWNRCRVSIPVMYFGLQRVADSTE
jgi:O-antigen/teichoic acid export membrane protein